MSAEARTGESSQEAAAEYLRVARAAAATVISSYSTSFSLAGALLGPTVREHVRSVYALVRVADEIVDGASAGAGLEPQDSLALLDGFERATLEAMDSGFSTDLVIHAFAATARETGIEAELVRPFFASMRTDLGVEHHDAASLDEYVYGSAEVVGLMCLRIFLAGRPDPQRRYTELSDSARSLGSAFQKVNFLRDLSQDLDELGRTYFPGTDPRHLQEAQKDGLLDEIDDELRLARRGIDELPDSARVAVLLAHDLFAELSRRLRRTPARSLMHDRVRVPDARKAALAARALVVARTRRPVSTTPSRAAGLTSRTKQGGRLGVAARLTRDARRRLRLGVRSDGSTSPRETGEAPRAVVIGAGISGLAAAGLLSRDGYDVTVLERNEAVGGRAGAIRRDGFRFDTGPSWYLMPEVFEHAFRMLGTTSARELDLQVLDPAYRVFGEGHETPLEIRSDLEDTVRVFEAVEAGSGDRLRRYLGSARRIYHLSVRDFLYTSFTDLRPLLSRQVLRELPALAWHLLRSLETQAGRVAQDIRLRQILGYPAVFLASEPRSVPSLYHLMSHLDLTDSVQYPQGGFTTIIAAFQRLAVRHGAQVRTQAEATEITTREDPDTGRARTTGVRWRDADGVLHHESADVVIAAADLHHVETQLLPRPLQSYPQRYWERRTMGYGAVLVLLGVRGELPQLAHHSLLFTSDWDANFDAILGRPGHVPETTSIYVSRTTATDPDAAPAGHENLFVLVPVPADPSMGRGGDDGTGSPAVEAVADQVIAQIADWAQIPDLPERIVVRTTIGPGDFAADLNAWRGSALGPSHTLRQSAFLRGHMRSQTVDGLHYCGSSTLPGVGLPMCLISAENVLKDLRGDTSTGPLPEPALDEPALDEPGHAEPAGAHAAAHDHPRAAGERGA